MPRHARSPRGGVIYQVLNRAREGKRLFAGADDYSAFEAILREALERVPIRILGYCLMPNHWHMVLLPKTGRQLSDFLRWITVTHTQRMYARRGVSGKGGIYQGRFRSGPVEEGPALLTMCRYIEANPVRSKLVKKAEAWRWSSLHLRGGGSGDESVLAKSPVKLPPKWTALVNRPLDEMELAAARTSAQRGRPFGGDAWVARTVKSMHLEWTMRPRGRPRTAAKPAAKAK
jgi:putative transposase